MCPSRCIGLHGPNGRGMQLRHVSIAEQLTEQWDGEKRHLLLSIYRLPMGVATVAPALEVPATGKPGSSIVSLNHHPVWQGAGESGSDESPGGSWWNVRDESAHRSPARLVLSRTHDAMLRGTQRIVTGGIPCRGDARQ